MQQTIAEHLGLDLSTVQNFFMNARRRCRDRFEEKHLAAAAAGALGDSSGNLDGMDDSPPESPGMSYSPLSPDAPVSPTAYRSATKQPAKLPCMSGIFPTGVTARQTDANGHPSNLPPMSLGSARHSVAQNPSASTPPMMLDRHSHLGQSASGAQSNKISSNSEGVAPRRREMSAALQESIAEVVDAVAAGHFDLPQHLLDSTPPGTKLADKFDHTAMLNYPAEPQKSNVAAVDDHHQQQFVLPSTETDVYSNENLFRNVNRQYDGHLLAQEDIKPYASELMRFNAILESNYAAKERENLLAVTTSVTTTTTSESQPPPSHLLMFDSHVGILDSSTLRSNYTPT